MISLLDRFYCAIPNNGIIYRTLRYAIRIFANIIFKLYVAKDKKQMDDETIIVSLTSYPARIKSLHLTIKSLLNQDYKNIHIVLWLSAEQFHDMNKLPSSLTKLQKNGLEIRLMPDDLRSHKKYYYAFKKYSDRFVITFDDDIIYNPQMVSSLMETYKKYPSSVICHRGVVIERMEYQKWKKAACEDNFTNRIMPTGIGGVLYPPHCYDEHIFDIATIKETCIDGDDLWINLMCRLKGTSVKISGLKTGLITLLSSQDSALCNKNCGEGRNDAQIRKINEWSQQVLGIDFFVNI